MENCNTVAVLLKQYKAQSVVDDSAMYYSVYPEVKRSLYNKCYCVFIRIEICVFIDESGF